METPFQAGIEANEDRQDQKIKAVATQATTR